jgi:hypothetical protein
MTTLLSHLLAVNLQGREPSSKILPFLEQPIPSDWLTHYTDLWLSWSHFYSSEGSPSPRTLSGGGHNSFGACIIAHPLTLPVLLPASSLPWVFIPWHALKTSHVLFLLSAPTLFALTIFQVGSSVFAQATLDCTPPTYTSRVTGMTGSCHHVQGFFFFFLVR